MLTSRLSIYLWGPGGSVTTYQDISALVENLAFSNLAPGGFGTLTGLIRIPKPQIPRPQFGLFSRVAIISRGKPVWLGELVSPSYGLTQQDGDYIKLSALGIGNGLRDDPHGWTYSGQTPQFIVQDQLSQAVTVKRTLASVLSTDNSQLFPDNPATTLSVVYDERTREEIISDIALQAGDYNWGVEADPQQKDSAGFPLGRLFVRARALTSVDYTASVAAKDIVQAEFTPAANRAYNRIQIDYANGTNGVGNAVATDPRINASDLSQGTAPFRFRKYLRDLSRMTTVNSTVAQAIANTYLGLFENVTYTGRLTLRGIRDGTGNPIPLWEMTAGKNLYIPELAILGQTLPSSPTQNVNLFWITSATYREDASGAQYLELEVGYLPDTPGVMVARLQMVSDAEARSGKVTNIVQALGAGLQGYWGFQFTFSGAGNAVGAAVTWQALASQAPTSVAITTISNTNVSGIAASHLTAIGCWIGGTSTAGGVGQALGTYLTAGNCLRALNHETRRYAHHCDACKREHTDLALDDHAYSSLALGAHPGASGMAVVCPACGVIESFNTALTVADEAGEWAHRAEQARLIRQAMAAMGLRTA